MAYLLLAAPPGLGHGVSPVGLSLLQFALIRVHKIPGSYAVLLFIALDFRSITINVQILPTVAVGWMTRVLYTMFIKT